MTEDQINRVERTWNLVVPIAGTVANLFYQRMFTLDENLREMFPPDMTDQKKKLMHVLGVAVGSLRKLDALLPFVEDLGRRHVGYGVRDEHYDTVGAALLWALEQGLGEVFTPEVREAWTETFTVLADTMKAAAKEVPVAV